MFSKEALVALPLTKDDLAILYGEEDDVDVAEDDEVCVPIRGSDTLEWDLLAQENDDELLQEIGDEIYIEQKDFYLMHHYRIINNTNRDSLKVKINLQSSFAPTIYPVYLQVWNVADDEWETLVSNNSHQANTDFDLEGEVNTDLVDYYDDDFEVAFRIYQFSNHLEESLCVDLVQLCFLIVYADKYDVHGSLYQDEYSEQDTPYTDKYTEQGNVYTQKYPLKRCE